MCLDSEFFNKKNGSKQKKVNRQSDIKLIKNGTSKSVSYLKNEPFSSYGPNKGNEKMNKKWTIIFGGE